MMEADSDPAGTLSKEDSEEEISVDDIGDLDQQWPDYGTVQLWITECLRDLKGASKDVIYGYIEQHFQDILEEEDLEILRVKIDEVLEESGEFVMIQSPEEVPDDIGVAIHPSKPLWFMESDAFELRKRKREEQQSSHLPQMQLKRPRSMHEEDKAIPVLALDTEERLMPGQPGHVPIKDMVLEALKSMGGKAVTADIVNYIETHYGENLIKQQVKNLTHNVSSILSTTAGISKENASKRKSPWILEDEAAARAYPEEDRKRRPWSPQELQQLQLMLKNGTPGAEEWDEIAAALGRSVKAVKQKAKDLEARSSLDQHEAGDEVEQEEEVHDLNIVDE